MVYNTHIKLRLKKDTREMLEITINRLPPKTYKAKRGMNLLFKVHQIINQ